MLRNLKRILRTAYLEQASGLFLKLLHELTHSVEVGRKANHLFAALLLLSLTLNSLNVVNSYVGRDFMSAIAERKEAAYVWLAVLYIGVFAASTLAGVFHRYCEERLGLLWREFMTRRFVQLYMQYPTYYRINDKLIRSSGVEYPDQRIADDVKAFTTITLAFVLLTVNSLFTIGMFSGVLLSISPWLFTATLVYAIIGSFFTVWLGKPLISLNYAQLDKEAAFRSDLIHVREHAESVALLHREGWLLPKLLRQFDDLVANFKKIIIVNRNMGFFTSGYNYLIQIVPILLVTPLYMRGEVEFGVITQSAMAFSTLVWAFSLIVTQFQSMSSYAAVVERLMNLWCIIDVVQSKEASGVDTVEKADTVAYEDLTLLSGTDGHVLVQDLNVSIPFGTRVFVACADVAAKDALFKATAGIYDSGNGRIVRPPLGRILFLPERPYLPAGTLRQTLIMEGTGTAQSDAHIEEVLRILRLNTIIARVGGLDVQQDWDTLLSQQEQRRISSARILLAAPRFVVLYDPFKDCDEETACEILQILTDHGINYLTFGQPGRHDAGVPEHYDAVLEIKAGGAWTLSRQAASVSV